MTTRPFVQLSNSAIGALACPALFHAKVVVEGRTSHGSRRAEMGKLGHQIPERYIPHLARTKRRRDYDEMARIVSEIGEPLDEAMRAEIDMLGSMLYSGFVLDKRADAHLVEYPVAVTRELQPITLSFDEHGNAVNLPCDVVTGRIDYLIVYRGGRRMVIFDFKMGEEHVSRGDAYFHAQGRFYAGLLFLTFPELEEVEFRLWGVRYGQKNQDGYTFQREFAVDEITRRIGAAFATLDALTAIYGDEPWPENDCSPRTCQFCDHAHRCSKNRRDIAALLEMPPLVNKRRAPKKKEKTVAA